MHPQIAGRMDLRRARLHRGECIGDWFQHCVIDFDFVRSLARMEGGIRHDHGQKIADATSRFANRHKYRQVRIIQPRAALLRARRRR